MPARRDIRIRPARREEAVELTGLCRRSKAYWGYDAAFLEASEASLAVTADDISDGRVLVAEGMDGEMLGVAAARPLAQGAFDLTLLFVEPAMIGTGVGRMLFHAIVALVASRGGHRLLIEADPNAERFYLKLGARSIGEARSTAIPRRMLPLLEFAVSPR